jgi:hypothetical protein
MLDIRLRRGNERVFYWVDALNRARTFNLDRPHNFYNAAYQAYLKLVAILIHLLEKSGMLILLT